MGLLIKKRGTQTANYRAIKELKLLDDGQLLIVLFDETALHASPDAVEDLFWTLNDHFARLPAPEGTRPRFQGSQT